MLIPQDFSYYLNKDAYVHMFSLYCQFKIQYINIISLTPIKVKSSKKVSKLLEASLTHSHNVNFQ